MYCNHPDLSEPNSSQVIWHYFSLAKFLWMLDESQLYLCRNDKFDDSFEGCLSLVDIQFLNGIHPGMSDYMVEDKFGCYYSNCWTKFDVDEFVLWNTYSSLKDGVAVKSTVKRLIESLNVELEKDVYVSDVLYIDYSKDYTFKKTGGIVNSLAPHFTKRGYFSSEKELRIMYVDPFGKYSSSPEGIGVNVNLNILIEEVFVAPLSYKWYKKVIENVLEGKGLGNIQVKQSLI